MIVSSERYLEEIRVTNNNKTWPSINYEYVFDDDDDLGFRAPQQRSYMAPMSTSLPELSHYLSIVLAGTASKLQKCPISFNRFYWKNLTWNSNFQTLDF